MRTTRRYAGYAIEGGIASADEVRNSDSRENGHAPEPERPTQKAPAEYLNRLGRATKATRMSEKQLQAEWKKLGFEGRASASLTPAEMDRAVTHFESLKAPPTEPDEASLEF
jgi:hypothetical protein